ncbi:MAG: hypothetical protein EAZ55_01225 [Cytophagales bacterium]|nr:MAG: hypothetical protein EAZ55_01225 [Cytophagales bacterium]
MKKHITKIILTTIICIGAFNAQAQDVRPFRIGLKVGLPIYIGGTIEYVLPSEKNRVGIVADFSSLLIDGGTRNYNYTYWSLGTNIYLNKESIARGPYLGVSYANLHFMVNYVGITSGTNINGTGAVKVNVPQVQLRFGIKTGKGAFFLQPEIGYGISSFPSNNTLNVTYPNGQTLNVIQPFDVPRNAFTLIMNVTLGVIF